MCAPNRFDCLSTPVSSVLVLVLTATGSLRSGYQHLTCVQRNPFTYLRELSWPYV